MIADYLPALLAAWGVQLMGVLSPGPGVLMILGVATSSGRVPALVTATGISLASIILALATVAGISALLAQVSGALTVVRLAGSAYLAYLAYKAFRRCIAPPPIRVAPVPIRGLARLACAGFFLQISNPKALFFWLAIASLGGFFGAPLPVLAVFVAGAFVQSFIGHGGYALLLSSGPIRRGYGRAQRWIEGALGVFFSGFALKLATERS